MRSYKTLLQPGSSTEIIQKSRFISLACGVQEEQAVAEVLKAQKALYPDAAHHCYAYILGEDGNTARFQDDGEPSGTAGMPILEVLRKWELTNVLVVITRYFGGTLLGTGGLVRAYAGGTAAALSNAAVAEMVPSTAYLCETDYSRYARLEAFFKQSDYLQLLDVTFSDKIQAHCMARTSDAQRLAEDIAARTDGQARLTETEIKYYPWPQGKI